MTEIKHNNTNSEINMEKINYAKNDSQGKLLMSAMRIRKGSAPASSIVYNIRPLFLLSKNPNAKTINTKSSLGNKLYTFKAAMSKNLYRLHRGDKTTIMPIALSKLK